ncbi:hypothetical protein C8F04DRAFT_1274563 [Mycena alexandri]|uniref:Uncharacterized protein n=1 Tax=Mycena alexandri TaxID=1745969 RepID=A0AAD6S4Q5_9AGAR|nr:hypothetical protein C8F04DRAFT_1274563 [Mycena alexandri]
MDIAQTRFKEYEQEYQKQKDEETYKFSLPVTCSSLRPSTPLMSPPPLVSSASPLLTSNVPTRTPQPREAPSSRSRSIAADPPERSPSAVGPSVKALVATIESALALERSTVTLNEPASRARSVELTLDSGGCNMGHSVCKLLDAPTGHPTSTSSPGSAGAATVVTVAVEPGGKQSEPAKSSAVLKNQARLTSSDFDKNDPGLTFSSISSSRPSHCVNVAPKLPGIRSKSSPRDNVSANAFCTPQSKFPAPVSAIADTVELGGLGIESAEACTRTSTVERGVHVPAILTRKPNAGWKAWQAAEARLARVHMATTTSSARLSSILHNATLSGTAGSGGQLSSQNHDEMDADTHTLDTARTNAEAPSSSPPASISPPISLAFTPSSSSHSPAHFLVTDYKTSALVSVVVRTGITSQVSHLVVSVHEDPAPWLDWERVGIGTCPWGSNSRRGVIRTAVP